MVFGSVVTLYTDIQLVIALRDISYQRLMIDCLLVLRPQSLLLIIYVNQINTMIIMITLLI